MRANQNRRKGFSLIELSIVLTIASILLTGFLQFYSVIERGKKYEVTKQRLRDIRTALTHYVIMHGHLPCPAGVAGEYPAAQCTQAAEPMAGVGSYNVNKMNSGADPQNEIWIGILPGKELRFDREQMLDGWGHAFTYAVSRRLTLPNGMIGNPVPSGVITVVDQNGDSVLDKPDTGRYVVVSHGPTAAGAWLPEGRRKPCTENTLDGKNCLGMNVFVVAPASDVQGKYFYDDIVIHDNLNAGRALIDSLAICSRKQGFYDPANPYADRDGCILSRQRLR
jgi:prepilin-type N-terminal cleavage/methylation domain-containing protein